IAGDRSTIHLDGDLDSLSASLSHLDLTALNAFLFPDSAAIRKGLLNGQISYDAGRQLDVTASIDSLVIDQTGPVFMTASAVTDGERIPFEIEMTSAASTVRSEGRYDLASGAVDAFINVDIDSLSEFGELVNDVLGEL